MPQILCRYPRPTPLLLSIVLSLAIASPMTAAQPDAGTAQPDAFNFGVVQRGAVVEGSVRVFENGNSAVGVPFHATPPPFARIQRTNLGTQTYGEYGPRIIADVFIAIDTRTLGDHSGTLAVEVNARTVEVPVTVTVAPRDPSSIAVLVTETPFSYVSTDDSTMFNEWLALVKDANLNPHFLSVTRGQSVLRNIELDDYDVVILGESGICGVLDSDIEKLLAFAEAGGRVIVSANLFYGNSVDMGNRLLEKAGLKIFYEEPDSSGPFELRGDDIVSDPLTATVSSVKSFRPSPTAITDESVARILVKAPQYPGKAYVAVGRLGDGEIVALGQSLWWEWISNHRFEGSDNARLMRNLIALPDDAR